MIAVKTRRSAVVVIMLAILMGACSKTSNTSSSSPSPSETDVIASTCPSASPGTATLPGGFPTLTGVTFTSSTKAGPTTIVAGYSPTDMDALFTQLKQAFATGGFSVTKSEKDVHDAEVDFAGKSTTGLVKLNETCAGRTYVTVTIRPA